MVVVALHRPLLPPRPSMPACRWAAGGTLMVSRLLITSSLLQRFVDASSRMQNQSQPSTPRKIEPSEPGIARVGVHAYMGRWVWQPAAGFVVKTVSDRYPVSIRSKTMGYPTHSDTISGSHDVLPLLSSHSCKHLPPHVSEQSAELPRLLCCRRCGQDAAACAEERGLKGMLPAGVAFHNAAMTPRDRAMVERLFVAGDLQASAITAASHSLVIDGYFTTDRALTCQLEAAMKY